MVIMKDKLREQAKRLEKEGSEEEEYIKVVSQLGEILMEEHGILRKKVVDE